MPTHITKHQLRRELAKDLRQLGETKYKSIANSLMKSYPNVTNTKPLVGKYFSSKSKKP